MQPAPKLSVVVITCNHEAHLAQALDSVLMQEVTFAYELIVGEDGSSDQTRQILEDYAQRYPTIIRPIYHSSRVGVGGNVKACFAACRGQYLATLEGDDYWTDPHKLQIQVTWLDANPDFSFCFHHLGIRTERLGEPAILECPEPSDNERTVFEFTDFLHYIAPHISTIVLRQVVPTLPEWLFTVYPIDVPLRVLYAEHGKAKLLPGVRSVYRVHEGGSWSTLTRTRRIQHYVLMYKELRKHYVGTVHESLVAKCYARMHLTVADESIREGNLAEARELVGQFWAPDISYATKGALFKSLTGVTLRLAKGHIKRFLSAKA
jgi:glycosyltransferase involved in cell wall biosynthesis